MPDDQRLHTIVDTDDDGHNRALAANRVLIESCRRCAGRMADCLICGNRGRQPQLLLELDFDGA
jgi:hypothetical protein